MSNDVFDAEEFISRIIAGVNDHLESAESPLERNALLQLAFFLMAFVSMVLAGMSYMESREANELARESAGDEKQHTESIVEGLKNIEDAVRDLSGESSDLFIVVTPIPLLRTADKDAEAVLDINPGDIVQVLERSGDWARVAYYDRIQGQTVAGWVTVDVLREIASR